MQKVLDMGYACANPELRRNRRSQYRRDNTAPYERLNHPEQGVVRTPYSNSHQGSGASPGLAPCGETAAASSLFL